MKSSDKENIINEALALVLEANKKGISNYRIAKDTNITERTIGNYVNGDSKPTFANAKILIDYFSRSGSINVRGDSNIANTGIIGGDVTSSSDVDEVKKLKAIIKDLEEQNGQLKKDKEFLQKHIDTLEQINKNKN